MEQNELRKWEAKCTQEEPPRCKAGCPLNVDARGFVQAMTQGRLQEARAILEKSMPIPAITASLCEAPCEEHCLRKDLGGAVAVGLLERNCLSRTISRAKSLRLPPRQKSVAIVGGGPSCLVCAHDLSRKGYPVTIFTSGSPTGWLQELPEDRLPAQRVSEEIQKLTKNGVAFQDVKTIDLALIAELSKKFDALFLSCDEPLSAPLANLATLTDAQTGATSNPSLFSGPIPDAGRLSYIAGASAGREAATSIDRFLQGASLTASRLYPRKGQTDLFTETAGVTDSPRIIPQSTDYTEEEAADEAARCLDCQCLVCVNHCQYLAKFKGYPKTYARQIYNNEAIVKGMHQANTLINSCALCGQCEILCPNDFSMAELCLQSRRKMVQDKRMPPSAHHFSLDEMHAALSDRTTFCTNARGQEKSSAMFFPGCQLAGVRPDQVEKLYDHLRTYMPDTGIWLSCCGAPAHWAGREDEMSDLKVKIRDQWERMGKPQLLCACASCLQMFREHLPEIDAVSVWTKLTTLPEQAAATTFPVGITDPCTARHDMEAQQGVRSILATLQQPQTPVPMSGELTECCGFGGLMANANPDLADTVGQARKAQIDAPFLTYCIMCREQLQQAGTPTLHLLDLLFPATARDPGTASVLLSDRRYNREMLTDKLRKQYCGMEPPAAPTWSTLQLEIPEELQSIMERRRILERDIKQVLHQAEETGDWLAHTTTEDRIARTNFGEVTVWVQYRKTDNVFCITSAWSHRMHIRRIAK